MSWAGKKSFKDRLKSLFPIREQALSSSSAFTQEDRNRLEALLQVWVQGKGYRLPHRTVAEAAQSIGTSSLLLYRYFEADGKDFRSWRTELRLRDAMQQMLSEPRTPLSTIARRVGFSDRSNFARLFKQYTGVTPLQWRKEMADRCRP